MKTKLRPGWVLALLCTVLFFYGFYLGGVQLVISEVSREYGQNAAGMGGLVAAQHVAAVVLPVVLGALADRIGKKPVLCIFAAVFAVGCFLAGLSKNLGVYVIGAVCVGAGYSVCESVSSAVLSELDAEKGARYINLSQALLSLGAVISPFLVQWLQKSRHVSWRLPFLICAAAYTLLALLLLLTVFPKRQTRHAEGKQRHGQTFSPHARSGCCFSQYCCMSGWKTASAILPRACFPCVCWRAVLPLRRSRPIGSA